MQINVSTCYAMQIILYLSQHGGTISSSALAEEFNISQRYILQVAGKLRDGCLIGTRAGAGGGYFLNKQTASISIYDIVLLMEGKTNIPECVAKYKNPTLNDALCTLKDFFITYLKTVTFDKLVQGKTCDEFYGFMEIVSLQIQEMAYDT